MDRAPTAYHANMYEALRTGKIEGHYDSLVVDDDELQRGLAHGRLVTDTRLRDALRELRESDGPRVRPSLG